MQRSGWCGLAGVGVAWVLVAAGVAAAEPWPSLSGTASVAEERIQKALAADTRLEFIETPLIDVVTFLREQHDIPIEIDGKSLDEVGVGSETPVTRNLKGVSLASALHLILDDLDLTYGIENEVVLITTRARAEASFRVRVYNVAPLLQDGLTAEDLAVALRDALGDLADRPDGPFSASGVPIVGMAADGPRGPKPAVPAAADPFGPAAPATAPAGPGADPFAEPAPAAGAAKPPALPAANDAAAGDPFAEPAGKPAVPPAPAADPFAEPAPGAAPPAFGGGPPPAYQPARRIVPLRHLLLVRDTWSGHREVAELLGAVAAGLREAPPAPK